MEGTLPASWYTSPDIYELERRAIYSKHWQLLTHKIRVPEVGSFVRYEAAGFQFFIIKDRKGEVNAFHNVCRHRAYPVIEKPSGKASIIACRYHGWSYGLSGNLAKAPAFNDASGFDKGQYSLFKIHTRVDKRGFIWINFDASETPVPWEELNESVDVEPRLDKYDLENGYKYDHTWSLKGNYNWKTSHPGIAAVTDLDNYAEGQFGQYGDSALTLVFPNVGVSISNPYFYIMRIIPPGPRSVVQEYEVFRNVNISDQEFEDADKFFKEFEAEDKDLCNNVGVNLASNTYVQGPLHPGKENGLKKHDAVEKETGRQYWPARWNQMLEGSVDEDELFCNNICGAGGENHSGLGW
ncbi:ISP domain-containing protein [Rhizodiscina lignyota]|uniref:Choline monooxygenase, chloroplastic n=1 Tax=Rhizodiscina lignyota TaxID=1504668 RepID=A0A9P4IC23_9PEZI|nr:ISP domain-containing protein [Rhizodiscina lignyota]